MQSGKEFLRLVDKVITKHPEAFEAMLEFERTKKLTRPSYKQIVNFTLDRKTVAKLREYSKVNNKKMSNIIEEFIEKELKNASEIN